VNTWNQDTAISKLNLIILDNELTGAKLSEADTRSKIIDYILIEVLGWSEKDITREERCIESNTYLDYKLSTNIPLFIVEAKKSNINFEMPSSSSQLRYKIGGVLANCQILMEAINQARQYAMSKGITYCLVTNGIQFAFFRSMNQEGIEWIHHQVIIFRSLEEVKSNFDLFCQLLSKASAELGKVHKALPVSKVDLEESTNFNTIEAAHFTRPRTKSRNPLFPYIGEIVRSVFQDLSAVGADEEILRNCYVESQKKGQGGKPYLDMDTQELKVTKRDAGDFQNRITTGLKAGELKSTEVILLLGSVGVGKSTFIQRFRKVLAKEDIDKHGIWLYFDFKKFSDTGETIDSFICNEIDDQLTEEYLNLELDSWKFLKQVYHAKYEKLKRGELAPLFNSSAEQFEIRFGEEIQENIKSNKFNHFTLLLKTASKRLSKTIFLVFDNADQLDTETQNKIFLAAQKMAETISCYALISMREESYWKNRDSGPISAFHTIAYHIEPPSLKQVVSKRFAYAKSLIGSEKLVTLFDFQVSAHELMAVFDRLVQTILGDDERYIEFIESVSARDTRRALDTIAAFLISGHTNIEALLKDVKRNTPKNLVIPFHEFLNAIILRDHETFNEELCDILGIFNVSGNADASNFNRIAVLGRILKAKSVKNQIGAGYVLINDVIEDCRVAGILPDTVISILNLLNSRRLIETETTIKESIATSKFVRITISGKYYLESLALMFGYLDIVVDQTPIGNQKYFIKMEKKVSELASITGKSPQNRFNRVMKRLELVEVFIDYLESEISRSKFSEMPEYFAVEATQLARKIRSSFTSERKLVEENARRVFLG